MALSLEQLIRNALADDVDYPEGTDLEYDPDPIPLLESHPEQAKIKRLLLTDGHITFMADYNLNGLVVMVLGAVGNLHWCCDYDCDSVIVGVPIILFVDEGRGGMISFHAQCFNRLVQEGTMSLQ